MVNEGSLLFSTGKKYYKHVKEMHQGQCERDSARLVCYAGDEFGRSGNSFPKTYHQCCITQIKKIIARQQQAVDGIGKMVIVAQQSFDIHPAIPVKSHSSLNSEQVGQQKIDNVCECVHNLNLMTQS